MIRFAIQRLVLMVVCQVAVMAYAVGPKQTSITIKVHRNTGSGVFLYKVENGQAVSLGFRRPAALDTCMFSFPMEKEGVYFIRKAGVHLSVFKHVIYLKPGDQKQVEVYVNNVSPEYDSCKVVNPNVETVHLQQWINRFDEYFKLGADRAKREQFIEEYNKLVKEAEWLKRKSTSNNQLFNRLFSSKVDVDIQYLKAAAFFYNGERMNGTYDSVQGHQVFYHSMGKQKFIAAKVFQSEYGLQLLKYNLAYNLVQKTGSQKQMLAIPFSEKAKLIINDSLRRIFVVDRMQQVTNYEQFKIDILPYKSLFATPALKSVYQKKEDELTLYAKGAPAYNFSLTDTKDQTYSLSDFKGKVVVIDIWAMWCAPCLTEKPFFQKIEESYKDREDIIFIGVSHDGLAKKEVWKQFVAKKGWKNIELIANYNESIGKYYKIEGIPRLMIFDKEGKIVTVDAPRPSSPAFKKLIDQTLGLK